MKAAREVAAGRQLHHQRDTSRPQRRALRPAHTGERQPEVVNGTVPPPARGERRERARRHHAFADELASWLLRGGLAFVFLYAAMSSFLHPDTFARYFPAFLPSAWARELLPGFAAFEVLLALGLLTRRFTYPAALLSALTLAGIVIMNPDAFEVLFRNIAIACAALALALQTRPSRPAAEAHGLESAEEHPPGSF